MGKNHSENKFTTPDNLAKKLSGDLHAALLRINKPKNETMPKTPANTLENMTILSFMQRYIKDRTPEVWLSKKGLMDLIIDENYQGQLKGYFGSTLGELILPHFSLTLKGVQNWCELMMGTGYFDDINGKNWTKEIDEAIKELHAACGEEKPDGVADFVRFWISTCSLYKALGDGSIKVC